MAQLIARSWIAVVSRTSREEGQSVTEYALVLALIVVGAVVAMTTIGKDVTNVLNQVAKAFPAT
jgi:Flp pilus assembly pilin Flp